MIGILDYGAGNIKSVQNALDRLGVEYFVSGNIEELEKAEKILFPGVGHAKAAMKILREKALDVFLKNTQKPVLGICLGMQMMFKFSEEGKTDCLGIFSGKVELFDLDKVKKNPHMGWNEVEYNVGKDVLKYTSTRDEFREISGEYFYFVHSYFVPIYETTVLTCQYGQQKFSAMVQQNNFTGMQFHPEKSGDIGEKILKWWLNN